MKKNIFIILMISFILLIVACSNNSEDNSSSNINSDSLNDNSSSFISDSSLSKDTESSVMSDSDSSSSHLPEESEVMGTTSGEQKDIQYELSEISNEGFGWGQGKNLNDQNQPLDALSFQEKFGKYSSYFIAPKTSEETMYLTFDNGYENGLTVDILDALKENDVPAVFFVTMDYVESEPELIQRMIDDGHVIGNHTWKHKRMPDISISDATDEIMMLHELMVEKFDYEMNLFRFPEGYYSERTLALVNNLGYKSLFWSYAYEDWDVNNQMGYEAAYKKVTDNMHDGAIYLLHSVSSDNAAILSDFIKEAKTQGYKFDTL